MKEFDFNFRDIVEFANDVVIVTKSFPINEPGPEIVYVNKAFTELTGYTQEDVLGKSPRILQSKETDDETKSIIRKGLIQQEPIRVPIKNHSKTGNEYWLDLSIMPLKNSEGLVTHFFAIQRDITEQKKIEKKLKVLSRTDPLTGLLNRRAFNEILENEQSRFKRSGQIYSLLMLDIDNFKRVNDEYGHLIGDETIQSVTKTCESHLRMHDCIARIGGEEFCILLPITTKDVAQEVAEKLRSIISNTFLNVKNSKLSVTVSIGVSEVEITDLDHIATLTRADRNLYKAKITGRNKVCI